MGVNLPWFGPVYLDIPCSPTSVPFADGFENKPTSYGNSFNPNLPDCWAYSVNANPNNSYSYGLLPYGAHTCFKLLRHRQSNVAGDTVVVSLLMIENLDTGRSCIEVQERLSTFYRSMMAVTTGAMGDYTSAVEVQNMNVTNNTCQQFSVYRIQRLFLLGHNVQRSCSI